MKIKSVRFLAVLLLGVLLPACSSGPLAVGDSAPDFKLPATDGSTVSLSDYKGGPVLLFFHMAVG